MDHKKKILAIVPHSQTYRKLEPILRRSEFEVSRAANATGSLILATNVPFDLIVADYPLPDVDLANFLGILQAPSLPSAAAPILLVTDEDNVAVVEEQINGYTHIRVASREASAQALHGLLAGSIEGVAARKASRLMVQLEAELDAGKLMRMCQTSNVSESGMLIHTSRSVPIDTELSLSFFLPGDPRPINAQVRVVRHTDAQREQVSGLGVSFVKLSNSARAKLREFVEDRWVAPADVAPPEVQIRPTQGSVQIT